MILGPDYVFISVPKCGTHTLYDLLCSQFEGVSADGPYHRKAIPKGHRNKFTFTVVRNPYTRALSIWNSCTRHPVYRPHYEKALSGDLSFKSFMQFALSYKHTSRLKGSGMLYATHKWLDDIEFDAVIKLENLKHDFDALPFVTKSYNIPHLLKRCTGDYEDHLDAESIGLVDCWAGDDFEKYGYRRLQDIV